MGSKTFDGVWFISYADDHEPPHVHGKYAGTTVILDLLENGVAESNRNKAIRPGNAKRSDVRKILATARERVADLRGLWEAMHGKSDHR